MNSYSLRIELVDATSADYERLSVLMEEHGFACTAHLRRKLQCAINGDISMETALNTAVKPIESLGKHFSAFITDPNTGKGAATIG